MINQAQVIETGPGWARVHLERCSACGKCRACVPLGGDAQIMEARAEDPLGVAVGDTVEVSMDDREFLAAAFLLYGLPAATFGGSLVLLSLFLPRLGLAGGVVDAGAALGALALMGLVFLGIHIREKKRPRGERQLKITDRLSLILAALALAGALVGCGRMHTVELEEQRLMGTTASVKALGRDRVLAESAAAKALAAMAEVELMMSVKTDHSPAARINAEAGGWVEVPEQLIRVLREAKVYCEISEGAFDVAVKPLLDMWGRVRETGAPPGDDEIRAGVELAGCDRVEIDEAGSRVRLTAPGAGIDLGGIAKGYAIDMGIEALESMGVQHALIDVGGDLRTLGRKNDRGGEPWTLGIVNPRDTEDILMLIRVADMAVATSGDYERYFVQEDGVRVHHILDPRTGRSAGLTISATVIAPTAIQADALATAVFVLGPEKGVALVENLIDVEALVISGDRRLFRSSGFSRYEIR